MKNRDDGQDDPKPARRTQSQRRDDMRQRLCEVTLDLICEVGYERLSTAMIARRAAVSRGAQTHHFPTKTDLLVEAFRYLMKRWENNRIAFEASRSKPIGVEDYIRHLWASAFSKSDYIAAIELMLAARGDPELREKLQDALSDWIEIRDTMFHDAVGMQISKEQAALFFQLNLCVLRGMAIHASFNRRPSNNDVLLDYWVGVAKNLIMSSK